jgi:hypothetical protein
MKRHRTILALWFFVLTASSMVQAANLYIDFDGAGYVAGQHPPLPWRDNSPNLTVEAGVGYLGTQGLRLTNNPNFDATYDLPTPLTSELGAVTIEVLTNPQGYSFNFGRVVGIYLMGVHPTANAAVVFDYSQGNPRVFISHRIGFDQYVTNVGSFTNFQWYQITLDIDENWENITFNVGPVGGTMLSVTKPYNGSAINRLNLGKNAESSRAAIYDNLSVIANTASVLDVYPYHASFTGAGIPPWNRLDTSKMLVKEGTGPQLLTYNNLINTAQGVNGLVFDIQNLRDSSNLSSEDFEFQVSPTGAFSAGDHPPTGWPAAPAPSSISLTPGDPDRVLVEWPDGSIMNRWLRVTVKDTEQTGLAEPVVYYIGHLLGETTSPTDGTFTVSFADITPIRSTVGQIVDASSIADIDKNGTVSFADISAMRGNVGTQLSQITVP